jgi:hypothetical protein
MIRINIDIVFQYIYFITRSYVPSIAHKKKIKQLFESLPFFLPKHQSLFFQIIKENSIINYYDTNSQMVNYGYMIYKLYHIKQQMSYLDQEDYVKHYDDILFVSQEEKTLDMKKKWTMVLFIIIVLICIYFIYAT